jgi:uncharacterized membrane protein
MGITPGRREVLNVCHAWVAIQMKAKHIVYAKWGIFSMKRPKDAQSARWGNTVYPGIFHAHDAQMVMQIQIKHRVFVKRGIFSVFYPTNAPSARWTNTVYRGMFHAHDAIAVNIQMKCNQLV